MAMMLGYFLFCGPSARTRTHTKDRNNDSHSKMWTFGYPKCLKHNSSDALNQKKAFLKATIHLKPTLMKQLKNPFKVLRVSVSHTIGTVTVSIQQQSCGSSISE